MHGLNESEQSYFLEKFWSLLQIKWKDVNEARGNFSRYLVFVNSGGVIVLIAVIAAFIQKESNIPFLILLTMAIFLIGLISSGAALLLDLLKLYFMANSYQNAFYGYANNQIEIEEFERIISELHIPAIRIWYYISSICFIVGLILGIVLLSSMQ